MKLTLANIKELKRKSDSPLTKRVCNYVIDRWGDYSDKKYIFTDVLHYGCQSGVVGELIYYSDTVRFYKQYRQEINALLYEIMNDTGLYAPSELFGDKWDNEDPLAQDDFNQNLLAWFGFEETLRNIGYNFEIAFKEKNHERQEHCKERKGDRASERDGYLRTVHKRLPRERHGLLL